MDHSVLKQDTMVEDDDSSKMNLSTIGSDSKISINSNVPYLLGTEDTLGEQALTAMEKARLALNLLEHSDRTYNVIENGIEETVPKEDDDIVGGGTEKACTDAGILSGSTSEVRDALKEIIAALTKSQERVKQLTLKNMFLLQHLNELQNGFKVEQNLAKQQFESMKYNLIVQKSNIQKQLENSSVKVSKYRETIIAKNREINRLSRLLNQGMIQNTKLLNRPHSMPSSIGKKSFFQAQTQSSDSNMLNTLGLLASKVLKEEERSPTQNSFSNNSGFSHSPGDTREERSINPDNTESDQSHDTTQILNQSSNSLSGTLNLNSSALPAVPTMVPVTQRFQHIPEVSTLRADINDKSDDIPSGTQIKVSPLNVNKPNLPKLKSFNSVGGSVKEAL